MQVQYPMMFKLTSASGSRATHCGVQEFSADESRAYLPQWMMQNLLLEEGDMVIVRNVQLPTASFVKLRPHSSAFLAITNPRAMLERKLRDYAALTVGDIIKLHYADTEFYFDVLEAKPAVRGGWGEGQAARSPQPPCSASTPPRCAPTHTTSRPSPVTPAPTVQPAVSVVETDCEVDFAPPLDYVEPDYKAAAAAAAAAAAGGGAGGGAGAGAGGGMFGGVAHAQLGGSARAGPGAGASASGGGAGAASASHASAAGFTLGASAASSASAVATASAASGGRRLGSAADAPPAGAAGGGSGRSPQLGAQAGGVLLATAASSAPKKRTLNRFEQARADACFKGEGRTLR